MERGSTEPSGRVHGPKPAAYQGRYGARALEEWADRLRDWSRSLKVVYLYFDNDQKGFAPEKGHDVAKSRGCGVQAPPSAETRFQPRLKRFSARPGLGLEIPGKRLC